MTARPSVADPSSEVAYRLDDQVGFILRLVQQRHAAIFAGAFGEDLTAMQWAALARLADLGECSQNHLGRLVAMDVATIKGVVERLGRRGYVESRPDAGDRRRLILSLTEAGAKAYRACEATALEVTEATLAPLSGLERRTLLDLMEKIR